MVDSVLTWSNQSYDLSAQPATFGQPNQHHVPVSPWTDTPSNFYVIKPNNGYFGFTHRSPRFRQTCCFAHVCKLCLVPQPLIGSHMRLHSIPLPLRLHRYLQCAQRDYAHAFAHMPESALRAARTKFYTLMLVEMLSVVLLLAVSSSDESILHYCPCIGGLPLSGTLSRSCAKCSHYSSS